MSEELVQQQLWHGTVVVLGSAVAAGSIVHTGLTGTSPLGDVEPSIRVPMEPLYQGRVMSLVKDAAQAAELQAMQSCGLDPEPLQMLRPMSSLPRRKQLP